MKYTVERLILEGTLLHLAKHFTGAVDNKTTPKESKYNIICAHITTTDDKFIQEYLQKNQSIEQGQIFHPLMGLSVDTISINKETSGYNAGALNRMGKHIPTDTQSGYLNNVLKLIPTTFDCTINFMSQSYWEAFSFATTWLYGVLNKENLNFNALFAGLRISIRLELIDNISFSPKDNALENSQSYYTSTATLKIHSYISQNKDLKDMVTSATLKQINIFPVVSTQISGASFLNENSFNEEAFVLNENNEAIVIKTKE